MRGNALTASAIRMRKANLHPLKIEYSWITGYLHEWGYVLTNFIYIYRFSKFINCHLNLNLNLNLNFVAQNKSHWDCDWEAMWIKLKYWTDSMILLFWKLKCLCYPVKANISYYSNIKFKKSILTRNTKLNIIIRYRTIL